MLTALGILGWILLALVLLVLVVLLSPFHMAFAVEKQEQAQFRFELRLFSRHLPRIIHIDRGMDDGAEPSVKAVRTEGDAKPKKRGGRFRLSGRRLRSVLSDLPGSLADTLRGIHFDRLKIDAGFGFADPADTGRVYGMLCPVERILQGEKFDISLRPNFAGPEITGTFAASLHFTPLRIAWPALRFAIRNFLLVR